MTDEEWDSLTTEEQEAHIKRMAYQVGRSRNRWALEILRFAEAAVRGGLVEMNVGHPCGPCSDGVHELTVKVIFE